MDNLDCPEGGWIALYEIVIELATYLGGPVNVKVTNTQ